VAWLLVSVTTSSLASPSLDIFLTAYLYWALYHWAHFIVLKLIFVYVYFVFVICGIIVTW